MGTTPLLGECGLRCTGVGVPLYYICTVVGDGLGQEGCSPGLDGVLGKVHKVGTGNLLSLLLPHSQWVKTDMVMIGHKVLLVQCAKSGCWGKVPDGFLE